jgi:hypothetical protein
VSQLVLKYRTRVVLKTNESIHNLRNRFVEYIYQENPDHKVFLNCPLEEVGGLKALLRGTQFLLDMETERSVVHAPNITDQEAYDLLRKDPQDPSLTKWRLKRFYEVEELKDEHFKDKKAETRFENWLNTFWKHPQDLELLDKEQFYDPKVLKSDMDNYVKRRELVLEVIQRAFGSTGRALKGEVYITKDLLSNGFNEWYEGNKQDLNSCLGLRTKEPLGALRATLEWVGLGLGTHRHRRRTPKEIPAMCASKVADIYTSPTRLDATEVTYQESYYSITGFDEQLKRACRLEPKHRTVKTKTSLSKLF